MTRRKTSVIKRPINAAAESITRLFESGSASEIQRHIESATAEIRANWTSSARESRRVSKTSVLEVTRIALGNNRPRPTEY